MPDFPNIIKRLADIDHGQIANDHALFTEKFTLQWLQTMMEVNTDDFQAIRAVRNGLLELGKSEQEVFWQLNDTFKDHLLKLMDDAHASERINSILKSLQHKLVKIKPPSNNKMSLKERFLLLFSLQPTAWQMWIESYQSLKVEIVESTKQLESEKLKLKRNNQLLAENQMLLNQKLIHIENGFDLLNVLKTKLQKHIDTDSSFNEEVTNMHDIEFMPVIKQRIIDLQQQLLVARQTVMTVELMMKKNTTQMNGVDQAIQSAVSTLDVTAGLILVEKGKETLKLKSSENSHNSMNKLSTKHELKQVQIRIDKALNKLDIARRESNSAVDEIKSAVNKPSSENT